MRMLSKLFVLAALLSASGCLRSPQGGDNSQSSDVDMSPSVVDMQAPEVIPTQIELVVERDQLKVGERVPFEVTVRDADGEIWEDAPVSLRARDLDDQGEEAEGQSVALSIDEEAGEIVAEGPGRARLIARSGTIIDQVDVLIVPDSNLAEPDALNRVVVGHRQRTDELIVYTDEAGERNAITRVCQVGTELKAGGALELQGRDLVATRPGWGTLTIDCSLFATLTGQRQRVYHYVVTPARRIESGEASSCMLDEEGALSCWGRNEHGQLGTPERRDRAHPLALPEPARATDLSVGPRHACAVGAAGEAWCWGDNRDGQSAPSLAPGQPYVAPTALSSPNARFVRVCAGGSFGCGLTSQARLLCWGRNTEQVLAGAVAPGELSAGLVELFPEQRYRGLACGSAHACATSLQGETSCWGAGARGQLGSVVEGSASATGQPQPLVGPTGALALERMASGPESTCGITPQGKLFCWGDNAGGQLTDLAEGSSQARPVLISPGADEVGRALDVDIGAGHACAIFEGSAGEPLTYCWGRHERGQLGVGEDSVQAAAPTRERREPSRIDGLEQDSRAPLFEDIAVGAEHTCALATPDFDAGRIFCWGGGANGRLGDGRTGIVGLDALAPSVRLGQDMELADAVALGEAHGCARRGQTIKCWGEASRGQRGRPEGVINRALGPTQVANLPPALESGGGLSAGAAHTCALDGASGQVFCWGLSDAGQAGPANMGVYSTPGGLGSPDGDNPFDRLALTMGRRVSCVVGGYQDDPTRGGGVAFCWGAGELGQLGRGPSSPTSEPVPSAQVAHEPLFMDVVARGALVCAWHNNATFYTELHCWGRDEHGVVKAWGDEIAPADRIMRAPEQLKIWRLDGVQQMAMGRAHMCALMFDNDEVICWGSDELGQLGNGAEGAVSLDDPARVGGLQGVAQIVAGLDHTCVRTDGDTIYCWGDNRRGQVGAVTERGPREGRHVMISPHQVFDGTSHEVLSLAAGDAHTCALMRRRDEPGQGGQIHCWGANDLGQVRADTADVPRWARAMRPRGVRPPSP